MAIGTPMKLDDVKLGVIHKDWLTGLQGFATAKSEALHGGHMVQLSTLDKTNRPIAEWVPLERITDVI